VSRALLACALVACGQIARAPDPWRASGVDWSRPPAVAADSPLAAPAVVELHLANSIRVLLCENHRLPLVSVTTMHLRAGSREDAAHPGIAGLTVEMLDRGVGRAAELAHEGMRVETAITSDYAAVRATVLARHFAPAMKLLADVVRRPQFDPLAFDRLRAERAAELEQQHAAPRAIAARVFDRIAFGDAHPYAHAAIGTAAGLAALTRIEVGGFYVAHYAPESTTIVIAGDVTRDQVQRALDDAFGDWRAVVRIGEPTPAPPTPAAVLAVVDVPGAAQTAVLIGRPVAAADPAASELANAFFGGGVHARLDRELRDRLGVTFGATSGFWRGEWANTWAIATSVRTDATVPAVRAALALIEDARSRDAPADELGAARVRIVRATAQAFDTTSSTARALEHLVALGRPLDDLATLPDRLARVTPEAARAAIAPLWATPSIVLAGDVAAMGDLAALGLPLVRYDADGQRQP
jgi:zinc protease